jgi:hypothetical protein
MRWLRRHTTECEREATRILNALDALHPDDRHSGSWKRRVLMETILEELTSPELAGSPWWAADGQLNEAVGRALGLRVVLTYADRVTVEYVAQPGHFWSVPIPRGGNLALVARAIQAWHEAKQASMQQQRLEAVVGPLDAAEPPGDPADDAAVVDVIRVPLGHE